MELTIDLPVDVVERLRKWAKIKNLTLEAFAVEYLATRLNMHNSQNNISESMYDDESEWDGDNNIIPTIVDVRQKR